MTAIMNIMPKRAMNGSGQPGPRNNRVAVLAYDGVNAFELGLAVEVSGLPNVGPDWYQVVVCAERPGVPLAAGGGVKVVAECGVSCLQQVVTIIFPGWQHVDAAPSDALLDALRSTHARGARIASICSGVFVVAAAGLLEGRCVAACWARAEALARKHPSLTVDPDVFYVDDGDIMSSVGRAAGLDLCVHIVRKDFGAEVANDVARRLVTPAHREGGQAQFIPRPVWPEGGPLVELRAWIRDHLDQDLTIADLSAKARMSRRTFIRRFEEAAGTSPGEWVAQERMAQACTLLEATGMSVEEVATAVGFGSADTLRHHFRVRFDTSPARYRMGFRT